MYSTPSSQRTSSSPFLEFWKKKLGVAGWTKTTQKLPKDFGKGEEEEDAYHPPLKRFGPNAKRRSEVASRHFVAAAAEKVPPARKKHTLKMGLLLGEEFWSRREGEREYLPQNFAATLFVATLFVVAMFFVELSVKFYRNVFILSLWQFYYTIFYNSLKRGHVLTQNWFGAQ